MKISRVFLAILASAALPAAAQQSVQAMGEVPGVGLAPAPRLEPDEVPMVTLPGFTTKAVVPVPAIDTTNMAAVLAAFNTYYNIAQPAVGFVGSTAGCNPGTESLAFQEWTISRINFLRAMAGVPGNTTLDVSKNGQEQAAALIMSANNTLNHFPTSAMTCWTQAGADGAGSSNLALGVTDAVQIYMSEPGGGNQVVGHRRWLLHSAKNSFGHGQVTDGPNTNALYTFQFGPAVSVPNGIPWPPRGYVPLQLFPTQFTSTQRWSFGLPNANFGAANVSVTLNGSPVTVNVVSRTDNGYGDNTIVWEMPAGHTVNAGSTYTVTISGVSGAAQTSYSYQIFPFDTANVAADLVLTQAASVASTTPGKDVAFTLSVANTGGGPATNVTLTDTIPASATLVWASPSCTRAGATLTCALGTVNGGAVSQVRVVLRPSAAGTLSNVASVASSPADSSSANNSSTSNVTVGAAPTPTTVLRYRLYSPVSLEHHYTTDLNEYNVLGASGAWVQEGTVGKVLNNPGSFNGVAATPYYRLYNTITRWHHWTTDANEYYTLIGFPGWNGEGVDGYVLPTSATGTMQLYRLVYPNGTGLHHWTVDSNEYTTLINTYGWVGEGGAGFVIQ